MTQIAVRIIELRMRLCSPSLRERPAGWLRQAYERGSMARWLRALERAHAGKLAETEAEAGEQRS